METTKLQIDETTFRAIYPLGVWPNGVIEVKATEEGLEFDEDFTVPWDWIFRAHRCCNPPAPVTSPER